MIPDLSEFFQALPPAQLFSREGVMVDSNSAWRDWAGASDERARPGYRLFDDPALAATDTTECFRKALGGNRAHAPARLNVFGRWTETNFIPIKGETGTVVAVLLLHHDVTGHIMALRRHEDLRRERLRAPD